MTKPDVKSFFDEATATWSYVVYVENGADKSCAIIDSVLDYDMHAGRTSTQSADKLIEFIRTNNLELVWILETHIHADHLTAAAYLKKTLGGKTGMSRRILKVLETWQPILQNAADTPQNGSQFDCLFDDNEVFKIGSLTAQIIPTPGHTPADTSYIIGDAVFVGDAMFLPDVGTGRCDFPGGSAADSFDSIRTLLSLPEDTRMYVGHDYPPAGKRGAECMARVATQKQNNMRVHDGVEKDDFVSKRTQDDKGKPVPKLLLPALQVNLRAGGFGEARDGVQFIKIPIDKI